MVDMAENSGDAESGVDIDRLEGDLLATIEAAGDLGELEHIRVAELGKKGRITALTKSLGALAPEARREAGQRYNQVKQAVIEAIAGKREALEASALDAKLVHETVDVTLPIRPEITGPAASGQPSYGRTDRDLRRDGLPGCRGAGCRRRLQQLHRPQHPARASRPPDAGHLLSGGGEGRRAAGLAHPHLAGADPDDALGPPPYRIIAPGAPIAATTT